MGAEDQPVWPPGQGEMAERVRTFDWASTPLGPPETWPRSLRVAVEMCLSSALSTSIQWGPEGTLIFNDAGRDMFPDRAPMALGLPFREVFADAWPLLKPHMETLAQTGRPVMFPDTPIRPLGAPPGVDERYFTLTYAPLRDDAGNIAGIISTSIDTSDRVIGDRSRRDAEAALRSREAELARAQRAGGVSSMHVDLTGDFIGRRSPEYRRLHGLDAALESETHEAWLSRLHPDDRERAERTFQQALEHGVYESEYRIIRPSDGDVRWISARGDVFYDEDGKPARLVGVHIDVTERREVEEALRESEARLQAALDAADMGTFIWHADGNRTEGDARLLALFGVTDPGDLTLRSELTAVIHPEDQERYAQAVRAALDPAGPGQLRSDIRVRPQNGGPERWLFVSARTVFENEAPVRVVGAAIDITERKDAEQGLSVLVAELQHRTRNLIAVVSALADKTVRESASLDDFKDRFSDRLAAVSRVQVLLSRLSEGERVTFDDLIRTELAAHAASPGQVLLDGPSGVPLRSGTVQTFALALHELATNAVKYGALSARGGRLTVRWWVESGPAPMLHVDWSETGVPMAHTAGALGGYGRELIERALPYQMKAKTSYALGHDGVRCTIAAPLAAEL